MDLDEVSSDEISSQLSSQNSQSSEIVFNQSATRSRKRKADASSQPNSLTKRLKVRQVEKYRRCFNESLEELKQREHSYQENAYAHARAKIRSMTWSTDEKDRLFLALERKGRHSYKSLAAFVSTKSEPEVRAFVQFLHSAATNHDFSSLYRKGLFDMSSIEAAIDVDPACGSALEVAADTLAAQQFGQEENAERALHPNRWLVTRKTAKWVEKCLESGGQGEETVAKEVPFATLLNIKHLLALSKQLYMNSKEPDRNWRTLRKLKISTSNAPSAFYSAFSELHSLVLARTQRLIQLSLFFAQSRIDAESAISTPGQAVRAADVLAAIEIAKMPLNSEEYWPGVAKRCNIRVFEQVSSRRYWGRRYSYEEVEETLRNADTRRGRYQTRDRSKSVDPSPSPQRPSDDDEEEEEEEAETDSEGAISSESRSSTEHSSSDESSVSYHSPPPPPSSSISQDAYARRHERHIVNQDAYLEALDETRSHTENQRLWRVWGRKEMNAADQKEESDLLRRRPLPPGKRKDDFTEWLDWIEYWDEWETPAGAPPAPAFDEMAERIAGEEDSDGDQGMYEAKEKEEEEEGEESDTDADAEDRDEGTNEEDSFVEYDSDTQSESSSSSAGSED